MALTIDQIETPALVVNEQVTLANIRKFQAHCDKVGLNLRPHIKTHKTVRFAKEQIAAGAIGITCQKISEAEIMANAGIKDILITYNIVGSAKISRLRELAQNVEKLQVVADNETVVQGLSDGFRDAEKPLGIKVECDTGAGRCGVQTPAAAVTLAKFIEESDGVYFAGLMTYPAPGGGENVAAFMTEARAMLKADGISCQTVSAGGSPDMWRAKPQDVGDEYRIGTYIYNDASLIARGTCTEKECSARVLATVVSKPTATRAIIDAGSKVMTSDKLGSEYFGRIVGHPNITFVKQSEEHGILEGATDQLSIGDRIEIIPNHICVVVNMFNQLWVLDKSGNVESVQVNARGLVT